MAVSLRSPREIEAMRAVGLLAWQIVGRALDACRPGVTTAEIDRQIGRWLGDAGARSGAAKTRDAGRAYPASACIGVNDHAAHALPGPRPLEPGDLVWVDLSVERGGWCADLTRAAVVAEAGAQDRERARRSRRLANAAIAVLRSGVLAMRAGVRWSVVMGAMDGTARGLGVIVLPDLLGHGIGRRPHEAPALRHSAGDSSGAGGYRPGPGQDFLLHAGMVLAVEPVVVERMGEDDPGPGLVTLEDGWTIGTSDRRPACHEERTIAITPAGPDVLTGPAAGGVHALEAYAQAR